MPQLYRVKITSGEHAGRTVGPNVGGLVTNPELLANREVKIPGSKYSLYAIPAPQKWFEEPAKAVQAELKQLGYETELVVA